MIGGSIDYLVSSGHPGNYSRGVIIYEISPGFGDQNEDHDKSFDRESFGSEIKGWMVGELLFTH